MKTFDELVSGIKASNEAFNNMTNAEKRVVIAQDCLDRIQAGVYRGDTGAFLRISTVERFFVNDSFSETLNTQEFVCEGCAKGGLFLSYVARVNKFSVTDYTVGNQVSDAKHKKLYEIFSPEQLALIEYAFEGSQFMWDNPLTGEPIDLDEYYNSVSEFYRDYNDDNERLIAICENIIENKGEFIL